MPFSPSPYDAAAGGPSAGATLDNMRSNDILQEARNQTDRQTQESRLTNQFVNYTAPQLSSNLGANGQYYSSAAGSKPGARIGAIPEAQQQYQNQFADIETAFHRAQVDLKRQEYFAAFGSIL